MRRLVLLLAVLALAGCGGGDEAQPTTVETVKLPTTPTTTTSGDPGKDAIDAFVAAARDGDRAAMRRLLSIRAQDVPLAPLVKKLGALGDYKVIVSERITPELGVVAIDDGTTVYAVPLRLEGAAWTVEPKGAVTVRPIGPRPGAVEPLVAQIAAAAEGSGGEGNAVLYLDGRTEPQLQVRGTASNATLFANFEPPLGPGRHTVVVFANAGRQAGATGWAFTVRKQAG